jgi:preprotein translocase subunit SecA
LARENVHDEVLELVEHAIVGILDANWPEKGDPEPEVIAELATHLQTQFGIAFDPTQPPLTVDGEPASDREELARGIFDCAVAVLEAKRKECDELAAKHADVGYPTFAVLERDLMLHILDSQWKDHLHTMDGLREGIGLRGFAQRDPKLEYQREGYALFDEMNQRLDQQCVEVAFRFALPEPVTPGASAASSPLRSAPPPGPPGVPVARARPGSPGPPGDPQGEAEKVGRNAPCPCGSGKKYKKCHGA